MDQTSKAALKKFLHQHVDELVDSFSDHAIMPAAILELSLKNRCVKEDDEDIMVIEEICSRIIPYNNPTNLYELEDVEFYRTIEKDAKSIEHHSVAILGGDSE